MAVAYLEARKKGGRTYYYAKRSLRVDGKVTTRTVAYLGTDKKDAEQKLAVLNNPPLFTEKEEMRLKGVLSKYLRFKKSLDPITEEEVEKDFTILFVNETNHLEGSTFTVKETRMLLEDNITPDGKKLREVYEQVNTKKLFDRHKKKRFAITEGDIISMHEIFVQNIDTRTGYRTRAVRILGSATKTSPPEYVKADMRLLIKWYTAHKTVLHPVALAALFHAKFEQIHPFADGNGRVGRFIVHVLLDRTMPALFPDRTRYLDALEASQNRPLDSSGREDFDRILDYFVYAHERTWDRFFAER